MTPEGARADGGGRTADQRRFLAAHAGLPGPLPSEAAARAALARDRDAQLAADLHSALTVRSAASRLGLSPAQVRRRVAGGRLYGFRHGRLLYLPDWQFSGPGALPHLGEVLRALPADVHHASVTGFFTTPDDDLGGVTRAQWLAAGGDPEPVVFAALSLGWW